MRKRVAATSRFVRPSATSRAILDSASVSSSPAGVRPPMRASSARACSAQSGAPSRSKRARRPRGSCVRRRASSHGAASARGRAASARAGTDPCCGRAQRVRARSSRRRARDRHAPPSSSPRQRARIASAQARSSAAARSSHLASIRLGLVELADRDQRFKQVAELQTLCRLEHEGVAQARTRVSGTRSAAGGVSRRELEEAEHPAVAGLPMPIPAASACATARLRPGASLFDPATVRGDDRCGKVGAAGSRGRAVSGGRAPRSRIARPLPVPGSPSRAGSGTRAPPPRLRGRSAPSRRAGPPR